VRPLQTAKAADGTLIRYADHGPATGPAMVLLHGLGANGTQFAADAQHFAQQGWRVLVPDVRGHGQSEAPRGYRTEDFAIPVLASDMLAVLDAAGVDAVDWVGNSLGGIIALSLLGTAPHRLRSLAMFGTALRLNLPRIVATALPWGYRIVGRPLLSSLTGRMTTRHKAGQALVAKMLFEFDPHVGEAVADNVRRYDLTANALAYEGPILMLRGGRDRQVNLALRDSLPALNRLPNFTLVHLPEGGHCANLDVPEAFRSALTSFWAMNAARG
jgi:3-oxoadipate enol-lactonase